MRTAALFDLDGVVIDTEGQYTQFWTAIGQRDFPDNPNFAVDIKGHTLKQIVEEHYGSAPDAEKRMHEEIDAFEAQMTYPFVNGAIEFIKALKEAGIGIAVVTSSNQAKMASLYKSHPELESLFDRIFTAEDAQRSKPAPDCYINAAHWFGFEPSECFVFEDSLSGLQAGKDSGAIVIGLTTTNSAEIVQTYSDCVIPHFEHFTVEQLLKLKHMKTTKIK